MLNLHDSIISITNSFYELNSSLVSVSNSNRVFKIFSEKIIQYLEYDHICMLEYQWQIFAVR